MKKHLYLVGGTMGVGKTAACQALKRQLQNSVFLDGDWCWDANPFQVTDETKAMVMDNICHLLNNFLHCSAYEHVIFCWVMHEQSILDELLSHLDTAVCSVHAVSLMCSEEELTKRLSADIAAGRRQSDVIARSAARLPLYRQLNTVKLCCDALTPEQTAEKIKAFGIKSLEEMSLEELWQLFPIRLEAHRPCWKKWYAEQADALQRVLLPEQIVRISHIGSTAVETIWAKPIIDILVELSAQSDMKQAEARLCEAGWRCMSRQKGRISLNMGYTEQGFAEKVFHLHLRFSGDHDELYFRDYLQANDNAAKEYEKLKLSLWSKHEHDRDAYTAAKGEFVAACTALAKKLYLNRYENKTDM